MLHETTRAAALIALEKLHGAANYKPLDVVVESAAGPWLTDVDGNRYLDCVSAYSAVNQGHGHPRIRAALIAQAEKVTLTSRALRNAQLPLLLDELTSYCGMEMAILMNTGVEAVETSWKLARRWGYRVKGIAPDRARIIVLEDNFHGRTISVVGASSVPQYREDFGPFTPGFDLIPYGDIAALDAAITPDTCAFFFEPIQGEGGVNVPPAGYLRAAQELCRARNVLFIDDEIQTGFGRTGDRFAGDHDGLEPDMYVLGKALGGGFYPVSAVVASRELLGLFQPGDHGSTFGGNPLGCAVARAALAVTVDEDLAGNARRMGEDLRAGLRAIGSPLVAEVRGRGLLIGVETRVPANVLAHALLAEGVVAKDTRDNVLRFAPPLVIGSAEVDLIVRAATNAFAKIDATRS
jgi:ornithine--oxo-acid transaminase